MYAAHLYYPHLMHSQHASLPRPQTHLHHGILVVDLHCPHLVIAYSHWCLESCSTPCTDRYRQWKSNSTQPPYQFNRAEPYSSQQKYHDYRSGWELDAPMLEGSPTHRKTHHHPHR